MSSIARWSYKATATVRPFVSIDMLSGQTVYGEDYEIACNWIAESAQQRDERGAEFVSRHVIFTEDPRPKYLDLILLGGVGMALMAGSDTDHSGASSAAAGGRSQEHSRWEQILSKTSWDMAMFGDSPDYKLVT